MLRHQNLLIPQLTEDYQRVESALNYLNVHYREQPSLQEIAGSIGLSEFHFQRLFSRWVGISPKRFLQFLTKEHACRLLEQSTDLLEAAYSSGLSGPGRLHDLFITWEAVTPGEYKTRGSGLTIRYGLHPSPFGDCLIAKTDKGICFLAFSTGQELPQNLSGLLNRWKGANLIRDDESTLPLVQSIFHLTGEAPPQALKLHLCGTNFQLKVWEALLRIPPGKLATYERIAGAVGQPRAVRAVARAVGSNPVAYLIPCHRVIRKLGTMGGYRWGVVRKQAILGWEFSRESL